MRTLICLPFGQQENGSMTSQYGVGDHKVAKEENCKECNTKQTGSKDSLRRFY